MTYAFRGTIGLPAFQTILNDPRTQDIPLILETPSFERPVEVWGKEIAALNEVSGMKRVGSGAKEESEVETERKIEGLVEEIRAAVKLVGGKSKDKGTISKKATTGKRGKRKREESEEEESEEQDDEE